MTVRQADLDRTRFGTVLGQPAGNGGSLRLYVPEASWVAIGCRKRSERGGDEQAVFCKLAKELYLRVNSCWDKEFPRLADILFLHGFLLSRAAF